MKKPNQKGAMKMELKEPKTVSPQQALANLKNTIADNEKTIDKYTTMKADLEALIMALHEQNRVLRTCLYVPVIVPKVESPLNPAPDVAGAISTVVGDVKEG